MSDEEILIKVGISPIKRRCKKTAYNSLIICNADLQMYQLRELSLLK